MKKIFIVIIILFSLFLFKDVEAQNNMTAWSNVLSTAAGQAGYDSEITSPEPIIGVVIKALLSFLGVIFMMLMVYGGFLWMTARGNEDQVKKARDLITAAIIGLIIIILSYLISIFIIDALTEETLTL